MRDPSSYYVEFYAKYPWGLAYAKWINENPLRKWRTEMRRQPTPELIEWLKNRDPARDFGRALTDSDFEAILGMSPRVYRWMEQGQWLPTDDTLVDLASATEVPDFVEQWWAWVRAFPREIPIDGKGAIKFQRQSMLRLQRLLRSAA